MISPNISKSVNTLTNKIQIQIKEEIRKYFEPKGHGFIKAAGFKWTALSDM